MSSHKKQWVKRWKYEISATPTLPGVWARKEGGYLVRGRVTDPRTGEMREVMRVVEGGDPALAYQGLQEALQAIRTGRTVVSRPLFSRYTASLLERKLDDGTIASEAGKRKWLQITTQHLIPAFGTFAVDALRRADILEWRDKMAKRVRANDLSPNTANTWLSVLRSILGAAVVEFEIERNPTTGVEDFDTSTHETYTDEEPNALTAEELKLFMGRLHKDWPQHFAMAALGFATGLRPSSLRPLRREGKQADILWAEGVLLVRRSHTHGDEVMNKTKTGRRQRIALPKELVDILRWHADTLAEGPMAESELLFPSETGGFRSRAVLDKPFRAVAKAVGLTKRITARAMRRTFQDVARVAEVRDIVTRSISGHATETMQYHYSTVASDEQRDGLAKVISLGGFREARQSLASGVLDEPSQPGEVVGKVVGNKP